MLVNPEPWPDVEFDMTRGAERTLSRIGHKLTYEEEEWWARNPSGDGKSPAEEGRELAEEEGLRHVGDGATRTVWKPTDEFEGIIEASDPIIVKFAKFGRRDGIPVNMQSVDTWKRNDRDLKQYLVPLLAHDSDHLWLIQPKANAGLRVKEAKELRENIKSRGYRCRDADKRNMGTFRGKKVLIDYGEGCSKKVGGGV